MKHSGTIQTNQIEYKCSNCSLNALPSNNSRAYYCCEPFRFNKILCSKCKLYKQPCNQCKKKVASYVRFCLFRKSLSQKFKKLMKKNQLNPKFKEPQILNSTIEHSQTVFNVKELLTIQK